LLWQQAEKGAIFRTFWIALHFYGKLFLWLKVVNVLKKEKLWNMFLKI